MQKPNHLPPNRPPFGEFEASMAAMRRSVDWVARCTEALFEVMELSPGFGRCIGQESHCPPEEIRALTVNLAGHMLLACAVLQAGSSPRELEIE